MRKREAKRQCLDAQTILKYLDALLSEKEQLQAEKHFDKCKACKAVLEAELIAA